MAKRTSLYSKHLEHSGKIVDFNGWELPVQYSSIIEEHKSVREAAGIFDTSHMGEIFVTGPDAFDFVNFVTCNDLDKITFGKCLYTPVLNHEGNILDDIIVYLFSKYKIMLVVNAGNIDKIFSWLKEIQKENSFSVVLEDQSDNYSMLAVQGPKAIEYINKGFGEYLNKMGSFEFTEFKYQGKDIIFSTTGYTGELGGEFYLPNELAEQVFDLFVRVGVKPCGLGSRDTLRLEKGYSLYGNELNETTNPLEAGLEWTVSFDQGDFIGKEALIQIKKMGKSKKLTGYTTEEKMIPRHGDEVVEGDLVIGEVTSGCYSPSLKKVIGLAYIPDAHVEKSISIKVRNKIVTGIKCKRLFVV